MIRYKTSKIVPFQASKMFDLVGNIEEYPEFLPWCRAANIIERNVEDGQMSLLADLDISYKGIGQTFRSEVILIPCSSITTSHHQGPFNYLHSKWSFSPSEISEDYSKIEFEIEFEFKSKILESMMSVVFKNSANKMIKAFESRAFMIYSQH